MKTPLINNPIWIIVFDHSIKTDSLREKAQLMVPAPEFPNQFSEENKRLALDFLEKMNDSFKEITEAYLAEAEKDEEKKPQVEEIREKFKSLDAWIDWLRKWQRPTSGDPPA